MTRRTVVDEPKYYDFEIALTVDPIWCEEDEDGPRIDYRGDIRKVEEEDVVGRVRFFVFHFARCDAGRHGHGGTQKVGAILPPCWIPVGQRHRSPHD
jgi:hypothetical protein